MEERFDILAAKVLAGEATTQETAELRSLLAVDAELQAQFSRLEESDKLLRDGAAIAAEMDRGGNEKLPSSHQKELEAALQKRFESASDEQDRPGIPGWCMLFRPHWLVTTCLLVALVFTGIHVLRQFTATVPVQNALRGYVLIEQGNAQLRRSDGKTSVAAVMSFESGDTLSVADGGRVLIIASNVLRNLTGPVALKLDQLPSADLSPTNRSRTVQLALFAPADQLFGPELVVSTRSPSGIHIYSPRGRTASLAPLFVWESKPGENYEVRVTDESEPDTPVWEAHNVTPPIDFAERPDWSGRPLKPFRLYRLTVALTGQPGTTSDCTFLTAENPLPPESRPDLAKLKNAFELLSKSPAYVGDEIADLLTISDPLSSTDFAIHLKLMALGQLGYRQEVEALVSELRR